MMGSSCLDCALLPPSFATVPGHKPRALHRTERQHVFRWKQPALAPTEHRSRLLEIGGASAAWTVIRNAKQKIREYIAHRESRKQQMHAALKDGPREVPAIVKLIRTDVLEFLHAIAAQLVRSHLKNLLNQGRVADHDGVWEIK